MIAYGRNGTQEQMLLIFSSDIGGNSLFRAPGEADATNAAPMATAAVPATAAVAICAAKVAQAAQKKNPAHVKDDGECSERPGIQRNAASEPESNGVWPKSCVIHPAIQWQTPSL
jgi:hypothetical protein